ncbi:MAG: gamma-glutamyltransferase family protein, partial [Actinomycetota bacterium]
QGNMIVHLADEGASVGLDFYACAPGTARADMYTWVESPTQGGYRFVTEGDLNATGGLSVCIPGNVCGWVTAHRRWGKLSLETVVSPAVAACGGVALSERIAGFVVENRDRLARFPETAALFLRRDGSPKRPGEVLVQPELAETIRRIAAEGYEPFYTGDIAEDIAARVRGAGGILTEEDLARYPEELMWTRRPDRGAFRDHQVETPTPSSSAMLLPTLAVLGGIEFERYGWLSADHLHLLVEGMKPGVADRLAHVGDHTFVNLPLKGLLHPDYGAERRRSLRLDRASFPEAGDPWAFQGGGADDGKLTPVGASDHSGDGGCTTHHSHVDRWGNFVSMSQSLGDAFGSALMVPNRGLLLNNAMKLFDPRPSARAARISPYKRPLAPCPTLVLKDGRPLLALGSPSGTRIVSAIAQVLVNMFVYGRGLQASIDAPRVHWSGDEFEAEGSLPPDVRADLAARGHDVSNRGAGSPWFGAVQAAWRDPDSGLCKGAADPRRQGAAAGASFP